MSQRPRPRQPWPCPGRGPNRLPAPAATGIIEWVPCARGEPNSNPPATMLVRDRMTHEVVTVSPDSSLSDALALLRTHGFRQLPVLDGDRLVGVVGDRDLHNAREAGSGQGESVVGDLMTAWPVVVSPDTPVEDAAAILSEYQIGCLPVVNDGRVVGILTDTDLLESFVDLMVGREPHSRIELLAPDRPGELARVVRLIGIDHGINITGVVVPPGAGDRTRVVLHLETDSVEPLLENLRRLGYESGSPALTSRPA